MSHWQRVQNLFLDSVDLSHAERSEFLRTECKDDAETRAEVESLLAADEYSEALIESAVQFEATSLLDDQVLIGERLGLYRIVREIGRGGMGSVYLATRDDQEYQKEVALKIVKRGMDTEEVLRRFRYERQILAHLEHPFIARLFDGGSTSDGVPFFVMEYIEGRPVDVFCAENGLNTEARCELFLRILDAVAYAHRNLVVHRDLKPANILITADGTPKLLDFGLAKLISGDDDGDHTRTVSMRPFTPGYASPEQVQGHTLTTSTDIYSLGAILYELLIGRRAQPIDALTPAAIERAVCETEVERPSLHARELSSDLDNIVLMAMRKEPERRYQSATQFAEDLRRYLQGRPVLARQDSLHYRFAKFVSRNRLQVAMASLVAAALILGLVVSLVQTRRTEIALRKADSERLIALHQTSLADAARSAEVRQREEADRQRIVAGEQRDQALHQRALADERVQQMLQLADRALFDVHDAVATLPRSLAVRRTLVNTTLEYLQSLQKDAGLDDQMRATLAAGYYKIAMIQGDPVGASLQDYEGSESSLLAGQAILEPAYNRHPNNVEMMFRLIEIRTSLSELMYRSGRKEQGIQIEINLIPVAHRLAQVTHCTLNCKTQEPVIESYLATKFSADPERALEYENHAIQLIQNLLLQYPRDVLLRQNLGPMIAARAGMLRSLGELEKAGDNYRQSIEIREELLRNQPDDSALQRGLLVAYGTYATLLGVPWSPNLNRPAEARIYGAKAVSLARKLASADPENATARRDLAISLSRLAMIDPAADGVTASLSGLEEAQRLLAPIAAANAKSAEMANQLAAILEYKGHRLETLGRTEEAVTSYKQSIALLEPFLQSKNDSVTVQHLDGQESLALLYSSSPDSSSALDFADRSLAQAKEYSSLAPPTDVKTTALARAWSTLAMVQQRLGQLDQSKQSAASAMKLWGSVRKPGILTAHRKVLADTQAILLTN
jgi:serine/threonine protein kinase